LGQDVTVFSPAEMPMPYDFNERRLSDVSLGGPCTFTNHDEGVSEFQGRYEGPLILAFAAFSALVPVVVTSVFVPLVPFAVRAAAGIATAAAAAAASAA
jgi:hypothetical protein